MRHDRRAEDADGDEEHLLIPQNLGGRKETVGDADKVGLCENHVGEEAAADGQDERNHQRFDVAEALVLQEEHDEHIERSDDASPDQRNAEEQLQADRRADDFCKVTRRNGRLAEDPQRPDDRLRVIIAAGLREIAPGGDAELDAQVLEQDGHQVRDQDDREKRVAKFRPAREVGGPVARIHVADGDEESGAGEGEQLAPKRGVLRDADAAVDFRQRGLASRPAPAGFGMRAFHFQCG